MISQECQNTYSTIGIFRIFQHLSQRIKLLCQRYAEWHQIKRQHEELLRMENRMLKDIGLCRADIRKIIRGHKFWRHMFQPEEGDKAS